MPLKFNYNLFIWVELVFYDSRLKCFFENLHRWCTKLSAIDAGNVRTRTQGIREVRILTLDPTVIGINMSLLKSNNNIKLIVIHNEEREENIEGRLLRAHIRRRSYIIIRLTIKC
jgi:hypothetical protein